MNSALDHVKPEEAPASSREATGADWARTPERSNALALRVMSWIAIFLGRRMARGVLHLITAYFVLFASAPRRHAARYLQRALGRPATWRDLYRHVHAFASTVLDRVYLLRGRMDLFDMHVTGDELFAATLAEGRGAFLLGAHIGSFEALHAVGKCQPGLNIAMVMYPDNARLINSALEAIAPDFKLSVIALGRRDSTLAIRDWLDGGGLAGMLGDRSLPGEAARTGTVSVPFLGREAVFSDGPFRLAMLLRRRVIFMVGLYDGGARYDVRFEVLADFTQRIATPAERERCIREAVLAYAARLEALCRESPYNWFNFYDFWREESA
jgi:predicted LPLAT superfamily acyltransferase